MRLPLFYAWHVQLDGSAWFQHVTSLSGHANRPHIFGNIFFICLFGRLAEEREGPGHSWPLRGLRAVVRQIHLGDRSSLRRPFGSAIAVAVCCMQQHSPFLQKNGSALGVHTTPETGVTLAVRIEGETSHHQPGETGWFKIL